MLEWQMAGIRCRLSLLFPAAVVVMLTLDRTGMAAACLMASVIHEAGHFLMMLLLRVRPARMDIGLFGVRVVKNPADMASYWRGILISLGGPGANALMAAGLFLVRPDSLQFTVHVVMAVFHLLPAEPLDGGQALYSLLMSQREEQSADRVLFACSVVTVFLIAFAGCLVFLQSGYNFTLLVVGIYLLLFLFFRRKR